MHPDDFAKSTAAFAEANKAKNTFEVKRRIKAHDGTYKYMLTRASPIFDDKGNVKWWCGSCTDIDETERLQYELAVLPENLPTPIWKADLEGNTLYFNGKFQSYLGLPSKETKGVNVLAAAVVHPEDYTRSKKIFEDAVKEKRAFEMNRRLKAADGRFTWFLTRGSPIFDFDGNLLAFYGTCTDINEKMEAQNELTALPESLPQMVCTVLI